MLLAALVALTRPAPAAYAAIAFIAVVVIEISILLVMGSLNPRSVHCGLLAGVLGIIWICALNTAIFILIMFW